QENPRLVRGLDYYTRTAFEFWHRDLQGAQNALGGGGRYDGLAEVLGFPLTPGVGFGMGVDRVVLALERAGRTEPAPNARTRVIPAATGAERAAQLVARDLRLSGWTVAVEFGQRSLKSAMRQAGRSGAECVVILGEAELASGTAAVKDMASGEQRSVPVSEVLDE